MNEKASNERGGAATPELDGNHDARRPTWVARGQAAIDVASEPNEPEATSLVETLCNLRHWAEARGIAYDEADGRAGATRAGEAAIDVDGVDVFDDPPQFDPDQRRRALELIESLPWGDVEGHLVSMERALELLMEATAAEFERWEREGEHHFGDDEFGLSEDQVESMDDEWRLAYVARLVRSLGLIYGVQTD